MSRGSLYLIEMPQYSWNTAKDGIKHKLIDQYFIEKFYWSVLSIKMDLIFKFM
jgi:hypothetical protein